MSNIDRRLVDGNSQKSVREVLMRAEREFAQVGIIARLLENCTGNGEPTPRNGGGGSKANYRRRVRFLDE
jgi:hypothetical protein